MFLMEREAMKVRTKMLLAISTLPILLIFVIGSGWIQISHLNSTNEQIQSNFNSTVLAGTIRADIKDQGMYLRNLVIYSNEEAINEELAKLEVESENVRQNINFLEQNAQSSHQKDLVIKLKNVAEEFEIYKTQMITLLDAGEKQEARELISESSEQIHENFTLVLREITSSYEDELQNSLILMIKDTQKESIIISVFLAAGILLIMIIILRNVFSFTNRITSMSKVMRNIAAGKMSLTTKIEVISDDEFDQVASSFNQLTDTLDRQMEMEKEVTWKKSNIAEVSSSITGSHNLESLGKTLLSKVVPLVESNYAVFYAKEFDSRNNEQFQLISTFAVKDESSVKKTIQLGEGLLGQAIVERKAQFITNVPADYIRVSSGLGEATPVEVVILPIMFEGEVNAILEIASLNSLNVSQHSFLEELISNLGIVIESVMSRIQLAHLLEESQTLMEEVQAQSEELQNQQEELRATNEELEEQTQSLRQSEIKLQMQQEELEQTNAELEEKAKILEKQNMKYEEANRIVEQARKELEVKAEQLALSSKYKSEFLANMSHELRTPLNSLIILSKLLADNPSDNLSEKQVEYAKTIYSSGNDLLILINNILDLAKIESGKTEIMPGEVSIHDLVEFVENNFVAIADNQKVNFAIKVQEGIKPTIYSDQIRIQQVLKNLLSNAFKFTANGEVYLEITEDSSRTKEFGKAIIAFSVIDTGIGISKDKLGLIFEAFQQADGTTSRKYGGTGLGLSISREIADLLGGEIDVESEEGKGSKFTFYIGDYEQTQNEEIVIIPSEAAATTLDDVIDISTKEIESFTSQAPAKITETSHIKRLLIVDDDLNQRNSLMELIGNMDFIIKAVSSGKEAIETLKVESIDCIILDLGLIDTNGFDLLSDIKNNQANQHIKVFIYTGRDLTFKEEIELNKFAHTIIIKNEHSPERLVAELEDYLDDSKEDVENQDIVIQPVQSKQGLLGKKVLLVDDDIRNVFALSSVLEMAGMNVIFAENGIESLIMLEEHPDVALVLMDIMMPEMDGYEAIMKIRENPLYQNLPLIALTAKAMKEDREKCLEIGASDYIAKPVEPDQLISLIKVWLY